MKPNLRKQLPKQLYNLRLVLFENDGSIIQFRGTEIRPSYTPLFCPLTDKLLGFYISTQYQFVLSRIHYPNSVWPSDRIHINLESAIQWSKNHDVIQFLRDLDHKSKFLIDPVRDPHPFWKRQTPLFDSSFSNLDQWTMLTQNRLNQLKNSTAPTDFSSGLNNMAIMGVFLAILASIDPRAETIYHFDRYHDLISAEADAYLRTAYNYAYMFKIGEKGRLISYPQDFLDPNLPSNAILVQIPVPQYLHLLPKPPPPLSNGFTYMPLKNFKHVAKTLFIHEYKTAALFFLKKISILIQHDPALHEFMKKNCLRPRLLNQVQVRSHPSLIFLKSPLLPPCMKKLFANPTQLKHYARWQLAELAVDMDWSIHDLLEQFPLDQKSSNRQELAAAYASYRRKPRTLNRCQIYMRSNDLCPYNPLSFNKCCGPSISDIEDLAPSLSLKLRLSQPSFLKEPI